MSSQNFLKRMGMAVLLAAVIAVPMYAGSAVVGSVAGSKDATVGGQALLPSTTLFSGDNVQVKDGVAVVAMGQGSRMVFGRETQASFLREGDDVTVMLGGGNVLMYHPESGVGMKVKAGGVTVAPKAGSASQGEIAMLNGSVIVTSKEGTLKVEGNGPAQEVAKGKTITVKAKAAAGPQGAGGAASAGAPVSSMTAGEIATIGGAAAAGTGAGFSIAARSKASDAAEQSAAALAAAQEAAAAAKAACEAVSPAITCP
jgi:hypothetical protein